MRTHTHTYTRADTYTHTHTGTQTYLRTDTDTVCSAVAGGVRNVSRNAATFTYTLFLYRV